jgi:hypothetical protein
LQALNDSKLRGVTSRDGTTPVLELALNYPSDRNGPDGSATAGKKRKRSGTGRSKWVTVIVERGKFKASSLAAANGQDSTPAGGTIPERIEGLCTRAGISYYQLAKEMGVTRTTVHEVRKGHRPPTKKFMARLDLAERRIETSRHGEGFLVRIGEPLLRNWPPKKTEIPVTSCPSRQWGRARNQTRHRSK